MNKTEKLREIKDSIEAEGVDLWLHHYLDTDVQHLPEEVLNAADEAMEALVNLDETLIKHKLLDPKSVRKLDS